MKDREGPPDFGSYREMAEFWDEHGLDDFWDQTEPAGFELSPRVRRRYLVPLDRELLGRTKALTRLRGVSTESLVNLLLEQRLEQLELAGNRTTR